MTRFRSWRVLFALASLLMLLAWAVPWYRALTPATNAASPLRVALVFGFWWLGTYGLASWLERLRIRAVHRNQVLLGWFLFGLWSSFSTLLYFRPLVRPSGNWLTRPLLSLADLTALIPDEVVVALVMIGVGAHAVRAATEAVSPYQARRGFFTGLGMLLAFFFLNTLTTGETPGGLLYLFLFASLLAMGVARLAVIHRLRGGQGRAVDARWLAALVLISGAVVAVAGGLGAFLASEQGTLVRHVPLWIAGAVLVLMALILTPLVIALLYVVFGLVTWLLRVDFAPAVQAALFELRNTLSALAEVIQRWLAESGVGAWWLRLRRIGQPLFWLALIAAVALLALIEVRWRRARRHPMDALTEWEAITAESGWLTRLRAALRTRRRWITDETRRLVPRGWRWLAVARVRRWYARLMQLCARAGQPRPHSATPLEFLEALQAWLPERAGDAWLLTQAYLSVRYGEQDETSLDLSAVEAAWRRLCATLEAKKM